MLGSGDRDTLIWIKAGACSSGIGPAWPPRGVRGLVRPPAQELAGLLTLRPLEP